jgi:hypothetical protein
MTSRAATKSFNHCTYYVHHYSIGLWAIFRAAILSRAMPFTPLAGRSRSTLLLLSATHDSAVPFLPSTQRLRHFSGALLRSGMPFLLRRRVAPLFLLGQPFLFFFYFCRSRRARGCLFSALLIWAEATFVYALLAGLTVIRRLLAGRIDARREGTDAKSQKTSGGEELDGGDGGASHRGSAELTTFNTV